MPTASTHLASLASLAIHISWQNLAHRTREEYAYNDVTRLASLELWARLASRVSLL